MRKAPLLLLRLRFHVFIEPPEHFPNHVLDGRCPATGTQPSDAPAIENHVHGWNATVPLRGSGDGLTAVELVLAAVNCHVTVPEAVFCAVLLT